MLICSGCCCCCTSCLGTYSVMSLALSCTPAVSRASLPAQSRASCRHFPGEFMVGSHFHRRRFAHTRVCAGSEELLDLYHRVGTRSLSLAPGLQWTQQRCSPHPDPQRHVPGEESQRVGGGLHLHYASHESTGEHQHAAARRPAASASLPQVASVQLRSL